MFFTPAQEFRCHDNQFTSVAQQDDDWLVAAGGIVELWDLALCKLPGVAVAQQIMPGKFPPLARPLTGGGVQRAYFEHARRLSVQHTSDCESPKPWRRAKRKQS